MCVPLVFFMAFSPCRARQSDGRCSWLPNSFGVLIWVQFARTARLTFYGGEFDSWLCGGQHSYFFLCFPLKRSCVWTCDDYMVSISEPHKICQPYPGCFLPSMWLSIALTFPGQLRRLTITNHVGMARSNRPIARSVHIHHPQLLILTFAFISSGRRGLLWIHEHSRRQK